MIPVDESKVIGTYLNSLAPTALPERLTVAKFKTLADPQVPLRRWFLSPNCGGHATALRRSLALTMDNSDPT